MAPGMYYRRWCCFRHLAGSFANDFGANSRLQVDPLGRVIPDVFSQLLKAHRVAVDIVFVVQVFLNQDVHPREQQCQVSTRLDRKPVFRLPGRYRESRVHSDEGYVVVNRFGERLNLRVVKVLANVRADQNDATGIGHVGAFGRTGRLAESQCEADIARAATLGKRRFGKIVRT